MNYTLLNEGIYFYLIFSEISTIKIVYYDYFNSYD